MARTLTLLFAAVSLLPLGDRTFGEPKVAVLLSNPAINESSGVAKSILFPGRYYTHNDSGDIARFWRFDLKGNVEGPFVIVGADAVDWEDMASARIGNKSFLYFADIGDNSERRTSIQIYRVEEPMGKRGEIPKFEKWDLTYPDGPHNAETFMVNPSNGEMSIVTKAPSGVSSVFCLSCSAKPGKARLTKIGDLSFKGGFPGSQLVTGGDFSPDGHFIVLRTYLSAWEYDVPAKFERWILSKPRYVSVAPELQGEGIGYSLTGKMLVTTSEHAPCQISTIAIRK